MCSRRPALAVSGESRRDDCRRDDCGRARSCRHGPAFVHVAAQAARLRPSSGTRSMLAAQGRPRNTSSGEQASGQAPSSGAGGNTIVWGRAVRDTIVWGMGARHHRLGQVGRHHRLGHRGTTIVWGQSWWRHHRLGHGRQRHDRLGSAGGDTIVWGMGWRHHRLGYGWRHHRLGHGEVTPLSHAA